VLDIIKKSPHISRRWIPLLLELPDPHELQNLTSSQYYYGKLAILSREFRKLILRENQVFLQLFDCESIEQHEKILKNSPRDGCFDELNKSFELLSGVFRDQLPRDSSFYHIFILFEKLMNQTNPSIWTLLTKMYEEKSSMFLQAMCQHGFGLQIFEGINENDFSFDFLLVTNKQCSYPVSISMLQLVRRALSLRITPELIEAFQVMSKSSHDEDMKSIFAIGLNWILKYSKMIQNWSPFLNFILYSVIHEEQDPLCNFCLNVFLKGAFNSRESQEILEVWENFLSIPKNFYFFYRKPVFSQVLLIFLQTLEDHRFFHELCEFFSLVGHCAPSEIEGKFLEFCERMRGTPIMRQFHSFFYPLVYVTCRYCRAKIDDHGLKTVRMCQKCVRVDVGTPSDFFCSSDSD
jgi:hypothetical protein